ncbi:endonuclease/exonuclease/phosphatase family protein [Actinomadura barringtoniae]|uniref:endonuclease/exonuclease/phosphatase family protein n=1 Tax=Actinomadura barringtoniae TaxID=1427535 RepID=UPI001FB827D6|nr:endonuclease/exonuclease/phosphatase family protein [Actinomadura barringtoniae]
MFARLVAGAIIALPLAALPLGPTAEAATVRIRDVQGAAHRSPLNGRHVTGVAGIVTAVTGNGFWMQDPSPDKNDATSEGVFVFTRTRPTAVVADSVKVEGKVSEFRPGGSKTANLSRTEIDATRTAVLAHGRPLPAPILIGPKGRRAPGAINTGRLGDIETKGGFDPARNALDFYESLEGMRVRVQNAVAAGPTQDGEVPVIPEGGKGGQRLGAAPDDTRRIVLDDGLAALPPVSTGDRLPGPADGVLDYGFGTFKLLLTATPRAERGGLAPEATRAPKPGELAVATVALENFSPDTPAPRLRAYAGDIVQGLRSPDVVAVSGLLDNSGAKDDDTVVADQTVADLVTAISAAGGPPYDWRSITPRNKSDGGEKGGNNRVGFLFRTDRGLSFVDSPAEGSDDGPSGDDGDTGPNLTATPVKAVRAGKGVRLSLSPGRVAPTDPAWAGTRKPVAGEVTWQGRRIIIIANHWSPRTSDDQPDFGRFQPPARPTAWQREPQARVVAGFVKSIRAADKNADVIVAGNLNETESTEPLRMLTQDTGLRDLPAEVPAKDRYTAPAGALDHILLSPDLSRRKHEYDIVHRASDFADRAGDHDPSLVRIDFSAK